MDHYQKECSTCDGWGWLNGSVKNTCPDCKGAGVTNNAETLLNIEA